MKNNIEIEQETIKNWFDNTYSKRGELYLRPKEAYYIFAELLELDPSSKLLDVACGLGRMLEIGTAYDAEVYGIDLSSVAVLKAKDKLPNATILEGNAEHLPFENNVFDCVTCLGSLERMLNQDQVLAEIKRVTKKEAKICFMVRNSNSWRWIFTKKLLFTVNKQGHQDAKSYAEWELLFHKNNLQIATCIPDQWPVMHLLKWLSFGNFKGYKKIQKYLTPLKYANEFIFILKKID